MISLGRAVQLTALFSFFLSFSATYAHAEDKLMRNNIKKFIKETTKLTSGSAKDVDNAEIAAYLERHIAPEAQFKSSVTFAMPGFPAQAREISITKEAFIAQTLSGEKALGDYKNRVRVGSIKIAKDGKRAAVKTTGMESGTMTVPDENGETQDIPVEGISACDQVLTLADNGAIQMYSADCTTTIEFEQF